MPHISVQICVYGLYGTWRYGSALMAAPRASKTFSSDGENSQLSSKSISELFVTYISVSPPNWQLGIGNLGWRAIKLRALWMHSGLWSWTFLAVKQRSAEVTMSLLVPFSSKAVISASSSSSLLMRLSFKWRSSSSGKKLLQYKLRSFLHFVKAKIWTTLKRLICFKMWKNYSKKEQKCLLRNLLLHQILWGH